MKLARIRVSLYRSIGDQPAIIDLRKKITVLIGANNSGKSNILTALQTLHDRKSFTALSITDKHARDDNSKPRITFDFEVGPERDFPAAKIGDLISVTQEYGGAGSDPQSSEVTELSDLDLAKFHRRFTGGQLPTPPTGEHLARAGVAIASKLLASGLEMFPRVVLIPQHRRISLAREYALDGSGIPGLLGDWQHPEIGRDADVQRFERVQRLLRRLLHLPEARLEVSPKSSTIIVERDNLRLPLESYGTGIHQLIILAVAVVSLDACLVCIEEPEINLHPTLQRELLTFLMDETTNRYVISTHSHVLIEPNSDATILQTVLAGQVTIPRAVETSTHGLALLRDLGVRASDLLQANSVIWVEGPSDCIYLNHWLSLLAPDLAQGVHYTVMFYGGRLLSHLTLERDGAPAVADLIQLLRINQNSAIIIDSDRRQKTQKINRTKKRVRREAAKAGAFCWITRGREIENYLDSRAVSAAYAALTQRTVALQIDGFTPLEDCLKSAYGKHWRPSYSYDRAKPTRAREIAGQTRAEHFSTDLKRPLQRLIEMIRKATELNHSVS